MQKTKPNQNVEDRKELDKIILKSPWKNKQEVESPENTQESQEPLIQYLPPPNRRCSKVLPRKLYDAILNYASLVTGFQGLESSVLLQEVTHLNCVIFTHRKKKK